MGRRCILDVWRGWNVCIKSLYTLSFTYIPFSLPDSMDQGMFPMNARDSTLCNRPRMYTSVSLSLRLRLHLRLAEFPV